MMGDVSHNFGSDIDLSASGDMLYLDDPTQQMVIKRLLTPLGGDISNLQYGGGLGQFVGQSDAGTAIENVVRSQIYQEQSVAQIPEATVTTKAQADGITVCNIQYTDATSGQTQTLSFPMGS
jgi:phage baseplate assembly protein W